MAEHGPPGASGGWYRRMRPRPADEPHRTATPLELLFDLCFVVAVALAGGNLHHALVEHHIGDGVLHYAMVFFAIWWAWMSRLEQRTHGIPVLVSCLSAALALRALGLRRLAVIHPPWFPAEIDRLGAAYFRNQGFEVVHAAAAQIEGGQLAMEPPKVYEWTCAHVPAAAEAVFFGVGGFRVVGAIQALEKALGRPVLSANQVLVWHSLRLARVAVPVVNYGQIFARELPS